MPKERILYLDTARVIAMLWIVCYWHVKDYVEIGDTHTALTLYGDVFITDIMLGVFMFLSGFFMSKYSFENLLCLAESLDCFYEEMTEESSEGVLRDYVEKLSRAVYPLLLWSIYLYGLDCHDFTPTAWHDVLVNTQKNPEDSLAEVKKQIGNKLKELEDMHARDCQEKDRLTTALVHSKSVTPENAYLFVRGHDLFDHVVNSVAGPIVSKLRQKHYNQLRESTDALKNDKLKKYQNKQESVRDLLYKNFRYKEESEFYDKIANDAKRIWS